MTDLAPEHLKVASKLLGDAMDKAQDARLSHAAHAMQCADCDKAYQRISKLERKVRKWKRRTKAKPVAGTVGEWPNQGVPGPGSRVYKEWMHDARKSPAD